MEYKTDAWEKRELVELYEKVGWTPNRRNLINYVLEKRPKTLLEIAPITTDKKPNIDWWVWK